MFRFVIFLGALFVSETIGAALNSTGPGYVLGKDGPVTLSENNTPLVNSNAHVDLVFRTELVQNITDKLERFETEYSKLYAGLSSVDDVDEPADAAVSKVYWEMEDVYQRENESMTEYYKKDQAVKCFHYIDEIHDLIFIFRQMAYGPIKTNQEYANRYRDEGIALYKAAEEQLNYLKSLASTCKNDQCIGVQEQLEDLDFDRKLAHIYLAFRSSNSSIVAAMDKVRRGFTSYRNEYERLAVDSFTKFKNCVEQKEE